MIALSQHGGASRAADECCALLLARGKDDNEPTEAGRVGTSSSDADVTELHGKLGKLVRRTPPVDDVPERTSPTPQESPRTCTPRRRKHHKRPLAEAPVIVDAEALSELPSEFPFIRVTGISLMVNQET